MGHPPPSLRQSLARLSEALAAYVAATDDLRAAARDTQDLALQSMQHAHVIKHTFRGDDAGSKPGNAH